jgi:hypothetical protein
MIIGISGKIGSGKDTVGKIIQYFTSDDCSKYCLGLLKLGDSIEGYHNSNWQIKKFADKLKQIVSILTGIPVEDLEKEEIKNSTLGEEWVKYGYADGFYRYYNYGTETTIMNNKQCSKERYEQELIINPQTAYKHYYTVRDLLQLIGTEAMRDVIHSNIWVNALFVDYDEGFYPSTYSLKSNTIRPTSKDNTDNWIITDVRFHNELNAILERDGVVIRVNRFVGKRVYVLELEQPFENWYGEVIKYLGNKLYEVKDTKNKVHIVKDIQLREEEGHISETELDNVIFPYVISNDGTIEDLVLEVQRVLIELKFLKD